MELGQRLKDIRNLNKMSQEELADKIYVSRQTISNWENDKSYPDIHSLIMLSEIFNVTLDELVKGDIEIMKEKINEDIVSRFKKDSTIYGILLILSIVLIVPLNKYFGIAGDILWLSIFGVALFYAIRIEKVKKENDIYTYKEIVAFQNGEKLDEIEKNREKKKRNYQAIIFVLAAIIISLLITVLLHRLTDLF